MTKTLTLDPEETKDLRALIEYAYSDEETHYAAAAGTKRVRTKAERAFLAGHIFHTLKRLKKALDRAD